MFTSGALPMPMITVQKFHGCISRGNSGFLLHFCSMSPENWSVATTELCEEGNSGKRLDFLCELLQTQSCEIWDQCLIDTTSVMLIGSWKLDYTGDKDGQENLWYQIKNYKQKWCAFQRAWIAFMSTCAFMTELQPGNRSPGFSSISNSSFLPCTVILLWWGFWRYFSLFPWIKYFNKH